MVLGLAGDLVAVLLRDSWDTLWLQRVYREVYNYACSFIVLFISCVVWKSDITKADNDDPFTRGS